MKKYKVMGTTVVTVCKEVWANSESEAYEKAYERLSSLTEYCGNGGEDKLIGVADDGESVAADGYVEYDDIEMIEDDPDYFECPECGEECGYREGADGDVCWWCEYCGQSFDGDGDKIYIDFKDEE